MKKIISLSLIFVISLFGLSGCFFNRENPYPYRGEYKELYTTAIYNPDWKKTDDYTFYSITLWVITDKDGNYDKENGVMVMYSKANESDNSFIYDANEILEFKNKNDWKNNN